MKRIGKWNPDGRATAAPSAAAGVAAEASHSRKGPAVSSGFKGGKALGAKGGGARGGGASKAGWGGAVGKGLGKKRGSPF